jgi:hypothetical protein
LQEELNRNQIFDILNLDVDEAINDVTIKDVLKISKGHIIIDETFIKKKVYYKPLRKLSLMNKILPKINSEKIKVQVGRQ